MVLLKARENKREREKKVCFSSCPSTSVILNKKGKLFFDIKVQFIITIKLLFICFVEFYQHKISRVFRPPKKRISRKLDSSSFIRFIFGQFKKLYTISHWIFQSSCKICSIWPISINLTTTQKKQWAMNITILALHLKEMRN